ncbi:MAG: TIGR02281 family clan AA aspartic protease, partial [Isosphaeraceae bacterium]
GRSIGLTVLLAAVASAAAQGQDPAPAELTPQAVLKSHNLERSGTTWTLRDEKAVLKDLRDARDVYRQVAQGMMSQQELEFGAQNRQDALLQLRERSAVLDQSIAEFDVQLDALVAPPGGNNFVQQQRNLLSQQRNLLVAEHNQVVNQLNTLQEQQNKDQGQDQKLQLNAEVAQSREKYMQAVLDLRKSVDALTAKYDELAKNPEATKALEALSASTKSKQRLGPSAKIRDAIKLLEKAERSVQSETIELHRENGVFRVYSSLGKVPTKMIFDTGASLTTISAKLASRIGLKLKTGDPTVQLTTADGTVVEAKRLVIPSVRVGKFTVQNVECAVMPAEKGDVDPLLGQTFFKHFKVEFSAEAGRLSLKKLDTDGDGAETKTVADAETKTSAKATTKGRRAVRPPRAAVKSKRSTQNRPSASGGDAQAPPDGGPDPN